MVENLPPTDEETTPQKPGPFKPKDFIPAMVMMFGMGIYVSGLINYVHYFTFDVWSSPQMCASVIAIIIGILMVVLPLTGGNHGTE